MPDPTPDLHSLSSRIEKLEKQNRRMKQIGFIALIVAAALITMGQSSSKSKILEAEQLILKDKAGNFRIRLGMDSNDIASLTFSSKDYALTSLLSENTLMLWGNSGEVGISGKAPQIHIKDPEGYSTDIGVSSLVSTKTGAKHITSAASISMFNKEGKVLWSAP